MGAGISGLVAAREMRKAGVDVLVVDKSRGVGGRMANRRVGEAAFDTGAQFVTARDPWFIGLVTELEGANALVLWYHPSTSRGSSGNRYRGLPTMTGPAKWLAQGGDVRLAVKAEAISQETGGGWVIRADEGREYQAAAVILTAPVPQSLALLDSGEVELNGMVREQLTRVHYDPCLALLFRIRDDTTLGEPGVVDSSSDVIDWIADNHAKSVSPVGPALTVHCSHGYSADHYDDPDGAIIKTVKQELPSNLLADQVVAAVKRWRYARPHVRRDSPPPQESGRPGLFFAGDAFHSPRVEGAAVSGLAAANAVIRYLKKT